MRFRRNGGHDGSYADSPAFSDLAFLLIIYFIVIAGFSVTKGLVFSLPTASPPSTVIEENILRYRLDNSARIISGGEVVSGQKVESDINRVRESGGEPAVSLEVGPDCPWQALVYFVDLTRRLNVKTFSFTKEKL